MLQIKMHLYERIRHQILASNQAKNRYLVVFVDESEGTQYFVKS